MGIHVVSAAEIIERPRNLRPQVVLLGAGASCAAFPAGDPSGRRLPQMSDFIDVVGLRSLLEAEAPGFLKRIDDHNFEVVYSALSDVPELHELCRTVEQTVRAYFAGMRLPDTATIYDRLVLALRPTDSIFTFNWDPFLFDALERNRLALPPPRAHYLHGCVRVAKCAKHPHDAGREGNECPTCAAPLEAVPLLYPVAKKDYSGNSFIAGEWEAASEAFAQGLVLTIYGYGAPTSDAVAKQRLKAAWTALSRREMEHVELIDRPGMDTDVLTERWRPLTPTLHFQFLDAFADSHIARWPRRSSESWFYPMAEGKVCADFPLPATDDLGELQAYCERIAEHESSRV